MPRLNPTTGKRLSFRMKAPAAVHGPQGGAVTTAEEFTVKPDVRASTWQKEAFELSVLVGEVGYVHNLTANTMAACDLRIVKTNADGEEEPVEEGDPGARVDEALTGPRGGKRELMRRATLNYRIAGETFLIGSPTVDPGAVAKGDSPELVWEFLSTSELTSTVDGRLQRTQGRGLPQEILNVEDTYIARWWQSDPQFSSLPDCAMRRALPIARELVRMTQVVEASTKSRLAAQIFGVPEGMTFAGQAEDDPENDEMDPFIEALFEHMSTPVDDLSSAASLVPLVLRGDAEDLAAAGLIDIGREPGKWAQSLREEAIARLGRILDIPPEMMSGKANLNHWCFDPATEVLTTDGWKGIDTLDVGDMALTLNHETGVQEWQPVKVVGVFDHDGPMHRLEGNRVDAFTTTNHRWPVLDHKTGERRWRESQTLKSNDVIVTAAPAADLPTEAKWSDAIVELAGWLWTEGHIRIREGRNSPQVTIWQSNEVNADNVARIRRSLVDVFGEPLMDGTAVRPVGRERGWRAAPSWRERVRPDRPGMTEFILNSAAADVVAGLFADRDRKVLDLGFIRELTEAQLALFVDASIRADGSTLSAGTMQIAQSDPGRIAPIELAAIRLGLSTNVYPVGDDMTMLSISRQTKFRVAKKKMGTEHYTGKVWCPTVDNSTVMVRRSGRAYFTGQTGYSVDADFATKHVIPLGEGFAEFMSTAYLRPMLIAFEGMSEEQAADYSYVFDPSAIMAKADAGTTAITLFDKKVIGREAVGRINGVDEADILTDDEVAIELLRDMVSRNPNLLGTFGPYIPGFDKIGGRRRGGRRIERSTPKPEAKAPVEPAPDEIPESVKPKDPQSGGGEPPNPAVMAGILTAMADGSTPEEFRDDFEVAVAEWLVRQNIEPTSASLFRFHEASERAAEMAEEGTLSEETVLELLEPLGALA